MKDVFVIKTMYFIKCETLIYNVIFSKCDTIPHNFVAFRVYLAFCLINMYFITQKITDYSA